MKYYICIYFALLCIVYLESYKFPIVKLYSNADSFSFVKPLSQSKGISSQSNSDHSIDIAYKRCKEITEQFSKTFYMGSSFLCRDKRKHVWAIYAWCRRTDDLVDSPRASKNPDVLKKDLDIWRNRLDNIWADRPFDIYDLALSNTVKTYPKLQIQPFRDMIEGMIMDLPDIGKNRYDNFKELYLYCYRVAGTVGLMTLPILGTAKGFTEDDASVPGIALGIGLQLTNILRDVGEDLDLGRIYLPKDELKAFGLTEEDIFRREVSPKYIEFMKFQIERARRYYDEARQGIPMLDSTGRLAIQATLDLYSGILNKIELNGYDNFNKRAYTTKLEKLSILPRSLLSACIPSLGKNIAASGK